VSDLEMLQTGRVFSVDSRTWMYLNSCEPECNEANRYFLKVLYKSLWRNRL